MNGFIINSENYLEHSPQQEDETWIFGVLADNRAFIWKQRPSFLQVFAPVEQKIPSSYYYAHRKTIYSDDKGKKFTPYLFSSYTKLRAAKNNPKFHCLDEELDSFTQLLLHHNLKTSVRFLSPPTQETNDVVIYENPEVAPGEFIPKLKSVSIDIETGVKEDQLYSIALYGEDIQKVLIVDPNGDYAKHKKTSQQQHDLPYLAELTVECTPDEPSLLKKFLKDIQLLNPQIFMGWYVVGFDFNYLCKKYEEFNIPFTLGIGNTEVIRYKRKTARDVVIKVPGRAFVEGMDIVKWLGAPLPNYKLATAAHVFLGEKKTISLTGVEKIEEITRLYQTQKYDLVVYNIKDAELVSKLMEQFSAIPFQVQRSLLTGVPLERLRNNTDITHYTLLPLLRRKKLIATINISASAPPTPEAEAEVINAQKTGPCSVIHLKHFIPLTMLYYKIDPHGMLAAQENPEQALHTPSGSAFHAQKHFMPTAIATLLKLLQTTPPHAALPKKTIELTLTQLIAGLSVPNNRFAFPGLYQAILDNTMYLVKKLVHALEDLGINVLYYDIYMLIVKKPDLSLAAATSTTEETALLADQAAFIKKILVQAHKELLPQLFSGINHIPTLDLAQHFKQIFIPTQPRPTYAKQSFTPMQQRHTPYKEKSALNYFALTEEASYYRSLRDYYKLKVFLHTEATLVKAYLRGDNLPNAIASLKAELLAGKMDDMLVQKKKLTKPPQAYETTANLPPHIEAARKLSPHLTEKDFASRVHYIHYLITEAGGEPHQQCTQPINYNHYWQKEITPFIKKLFENTPVAEAIAPLLLSADVQPSLF